MRLRGRAAVVTGSSRGIGRAIAEAFAREGARVVVNSRSPAAARAAAEAIGEGAVGVAADVSIPEEAGRLMAAAVNAMGGIDVLVNNAGMAMAKDSLALSADDWRRTIDLDLSAVFFCSQQAARVMLQGPGGSIVNIASVQGFTPMVRRVAYATAKAGVVGMTRALAAEWAPAVRVNAIAPGYVATDMVHGLAAEGKVDLDAVARRTPMRRLATPAEVAAAAVFLAGEEAGYVTGETLLVDGGWVAWGGL